MVSVTWRSLPQMKGCVQSLSSHFISLKIRMSLDHLCEEGPAHREEIEIPFNVILFFSILLTILYGIHLNGHFYLFRWIARILFWIYHLWSRLHHMLFYWYFLLCFNHYIRQKETTPGSTQSRDHQIDQQIFPETLVPDTEVLITVRPQINFLQHNCINKPNATHITPTFPHRKECCCNFINQDLTFL